MNQTLIAPLTQNAKLGEGVATTYRPVGDASKGNGTCPSTCQFLPENGGKCYTRKFLVNRQQKASRLRSDSLDRLLLKGAKLVRLHTSGDLFIADETSKDGYSLDIPYLEEIIAWCKSNPDVTVWTYTHDVGKLISAGYTYAEKSFPANLHIVASLDSVVDKFLAVSNDFRFARVIENENEKSFNETLCPYDLALSRGQKPKTTCAKCTLCFNPKHVKNIAFMKQ